MKQNDYLKNLHSTLLEILDVVVDICQRHQLTYFLAYGSCLGAVRHQGFIPWDDDIDIGMPRQDYNQFVEICKSELPDGYFFQGLENEKHYWLAFSKIRKKGTRFVEAYTQEELPMDKQGIYIDIFPYEGAASLARSIQCKDRVVRKLRVALFLKLASLQNPDHGQIKYLAAKLVPWTVANTGIRQVMNSMNAEKPKLFLSSAQTQPLAAGLLSAVEGKIPVVEVPFENRKYCIPRDYDAYLTSLYGDYMKLPPEEQRRTHAPVQIDFGDGTVLIDED